MGFTCRASCSTFDGPQPFANALGGMIPRPVFPRDLGSVGPAKTRFLRMLEDVPHQGTQMVVRRLGPAKTLIIGTLRLGRHESIHLERIADRFVEEIGHGAPPS